MLHFAISSLTLIDVDYEKLRPWRSKSTSVAKPHEQELLRARMRNY